MRGRPFQPGNKYGHGRPPGSRNKVISKPQEVLEQHGDMLMKKCVFDGLKGDKTSLRLCIERLMPARRQRELQFKLPALKTIADLEAASEAVVRGVARGKLTPGEGQAFTLMLEGRRRVIETEDLEGRIRALEKGSNKRRQL